MLRGNKREHLQAGEGLFNKNYPTFDAIFKLWNFNK